MYPDKMFNILLFALFLLITGSKQLDEVGIGAIFEDNDDTIDEVVAFNQAIRKNNENGGIQINPIIRKISKEDTYNVGKITCLMIEESKGLSAIIGPQSESSISVIESLSNMLQIPQILTNEMSDSQSNSLTLNLHPDRDSIAKAIRDVVDGLDWPSFIILYEDDEGLLRLQEVLQLDDTSYILKKLDETNNYRLVLNEIKNEGETRFILDCDVDNIIEILSQAQEVGMLEDNYSYFLTSLDAHTLDYDDLDIDEAIIIALSLLSTNDTEEIGEALMYDAVELFATAFDNLNSTNNALTAFAKGCNDDYPENAWTYGAELYNAMIKSEIEGITGDIKFDTQGLRTDFELKVLELEENGFVEKSVWNGKLLNVEELTLSEIDVDDLENQTLIVSSRVGAPYLMPVQNYEEFEGNDRYEGFVVDLLDELSEILGFKYKIHIVEDGQYGYYSKREKKWTGMIQELVENKADLVVSDLTMTDERKKAIDFTVPFMTVGISVLYKKASSIPENMFTFMEPFSTGLWMCIGISYIVVSFMVFFVSRMTPDDWTVTSDTDCDVLENEWSFKNSFWLTLSAITIQGCNVLPKGISTRFVTGVWWVFSLIIVTYYIASITTLQTLKHINDNSIPRSVDDLAKQTDIKFGALQGGSTASFFKESELFVYQTIWNSMISSPNLFAKSNYEGMRRVQNENGKYAFFMESTSLEYAIERYCDLAQIGGLMNVNGYGIGFQRNSLYTPLFNDALRVLKKSGRIMEIKEKWWSEKGGNECDHNLFNRRTELTYEHLECVFIALGFGLFVAFLLAIAELLCKSNKIARKNNITFATALRKELTFILNIFEMKRRS